MSKQHTRTRIVFIKVIFYVALVIASLYLIGFIFSEWSNVLEPFKASIPFIQAAIILGIGYRVTNLIGEIAYKSVNQVNRDAAATARTVTRIICYGVLLSILTSVFNVGAEVALTIGSFSGIVAGFASQTVLSNALAGVFLIFTRPFKIGDEVTVLGQSGIVKDIKLMHTVLETQEGKEILIPNNTIIGTVIVVKKRTVEIKT